MVPILRHHPHHLQEAFSRLFSAMSCGTGSFADPPDLVAGTVDGQGKIIMSDFAVQVSSLYFLIQDSLYGIGASPSWKCYLGHITGMCRKDRLCWTAL